MVGGNLHLLRPFPAKFKGYGIPRSRLSFRLGKVSGSLPLPGSTSFCRLGVLEQSQTSFLLLSLSPGVPAFSLSTKAPLAGPRQLVGFCSPVLGFGLESGEGGGWRASHRNLTRGWLIRKRCGFNASRQGYNAY